MFHPRKGMELSIMQSMTGYGSGVVSDELHHITIETKSVNHRYLEVKCRGIQAYSYAEEPLITSVRQMLSRGSVLIHVNIVSSQQNKKITINKEIASNVYQNLKQLTSHLEIDNEIPLSLICDQPGVLIYDDIEVDQTQLTNKLQVALKTSLDALIVMRKNEGNRLNKDIKNHIKELLALTFDIEANVSNRIDSIKTRLEERIASLLDDHTLDQSRMAQEVAILVDKQDVSEEIVRLKSHIEQFEDLSNLDEPIGRRMDFLVQELGREINTIGSKVQSESITTQVIEAKSQLEKIREQVQNVE